MAYQIGQVFKENDLDNAANNTNLAGEGSPEHLLAHALLGAAVSAATGNDALTGGISASSGEVTATLLSKYIYQVDKPSELTAEQKDTISNITTLAGVAIGSTTGEVTDAVNAGETAKVAIEDNYLSSKDTQARESWKQQLKQCKDSRSYSCMKAREEIIRLNAKDSLNQKLLIAVCNNNPHSSDCAQAKQEANKIYKDLTQSSYRDIGNKAYSKEKAELGLTLKSLPTGTIKPNDPYSSYLKTWEGRLAKSTAEGLLSEIEGIAVAKALQPIARAGSGAYKASKVRWINSERQIANTINSNVKKMSVSELKKLDEYLLGRRLRPTTFAQTRNQYYADFEKNLAELSKTSAVDKFNAKNIDFSRVCNGPVCFTAGTLIHTIHGQKPIESIERGELVWSREEFGDKYDYRPVIATKVTPNVPIYEVKIQHDNGLEETFNTTEEHPFWIDGQGWRKASILEAGMKLLDKRGNATATVISQTALDETDTVYNFEVQDFSTYHIGELGVWVHNANCCDFTSNWGNIEAKFKEAGWVDPKTNRVRYLDPIDGKFKDFPDDVTPQVDHILPRAEAKKIAGKKLTTRELNKIINAPENLMPLPGPLNGSKSNLVEYKNGGWVQYKNKGNPIPIHPDYKEYIEGIQLRIQDKINKAVEAKEGK